MKIAAAPFVVLLMLAAPAAWAFAPPAEEEAVALVVPNDLRDIAVQASERLAPPDTPHLDLPPIAVPITSNGQLAGYSNLTIRLHLHDESGIAAIREHLHFVVHDLVRLGHAHPFTLVAGDDFDPGQTYEHWDSALDARLGEGVVADLEPLAASVLLQRRYR